MKIETTLGPLNAAALTKLTTQIKEMNKDEDITPSTIAKEALKNFIASEFYKMLLNEK